MKTHIQIVAALHMALGALSLFAALVVFAIFGLADGIIISQGEHQAASIVGIVGLVICGIITLLALPSIIAGWALLTGRAWGHPLCLVLGILDLINFPFGTALGIYTLWALLNKPQSQTV